MDYRKEHNGWLTFHEHWGLLWIVVAVAALAALTLPIVSRLRQPLQPKGTNMSGDFPNDNGLVYWCALSKPGTNLLQFVLLLPSASTTGPGGGDAWPSHGYDYFDLQVKSNGHQWKIQNNMDWKTGVQTVQFRDVTANAISELNLENGRFWQLDDAGNATRLETIDPTTMAKIFSEVKTNEMRMAMAPD